MSETIVEGETGVGAGLAAVVASRFGAGARLARLERLSGGASQELWSFDVETGGETLPLILRRNPGGSVQRESAAGMETEARLIELARAAGAPAPEVVHVCQPADGLGRGYVMERIAGETIARRILRDAEYAEARPKLARQLGEAAARIHAVDVAAAGALARGDAAIQPRGQLCRLQGVRHAAAGGRVGVPLAARAPAAATAAADRRPRRHAHRQHHRRSRGPERACSTGRWCTSAIRWRTWAGSASPPGASARWTSQPAASAAARSCSPATRR